MFSISPTTGVLVFSNMFSALRASSRATSCGVLTMMAHWDLERFSQRLGDVANPVLLVHARGDTAVPLGSVEGAGARIPGARLELMGNLGHLAHEEAPDQAAALIESIVQPISAGE